MRQIRRRLIAAGLLGSMLALAGCNTPATPAAKQINLTVMTWVTIGAEASQAIAEAYTKQHPNVHITLKEAEMEQMLGKSGAANTALTDGVDVALVPSNVAANLNQAGALKDLSTLRLPAPDPAIAPLADELGKAGGKRYGVPISVAPTFMLINQPALTQAGVKEPPLDWTMQDFEQVATGLKNGGANLMLSLDGVLEPIIRAYGGQVYDSVRQAWTLDTPEARQGLAELAKLVQAQLVSPTTGAAAYAAGGKGAPGLMALSGSVMIKGGGGGNSLPMAGPRGPKGRGTSASGVLAVVTASSANPDVAADFVRELLASPSIQKTLATGGIRPVTADAAAMSAWRERVGDRTAQVTDLALQGAYLPAEQLTGETYRIIAQALTPYLNGTANLDQVLPALMSSLH